MDGCRRVPSSSAIRPVPDRLGNGCWSAGPRVLILPDGVCPGCGRAQVGTGMTAVVRHDNTALSRPRPLQDAAPCKEIAGKHQTGRERPRTQSPHPLTLCLLLKRLHLRRRRCLSLVAKHS